MEQLIEQYGEYLYHLSYLYIKDRQLAEEITQDVLMKYDKSKEQYRGEATVKTYLTRILIHCCHDELRRQKRRRLLSWLVPSGRSVKSAETRYLQGELYQTLKAHVFALPVHYREVIVLFYYEEFTRELNKLIMTGTLNALTNATFEQESDTKGWVKFTDNDGSETGMGMVKNEQGIWQPSFGRAVYFPLE